MSQRGRVSRARAPAGHLRAELTASDECPALRARMCPRWSLKSASAGGWSIPIRVDSRFVLLLAKRANSGLAQRRMAQQPISLSDSKAFHQRFLNTESSPFESAAIPGTAICSLPYRARSFLWQVAVQHPQSNLAVIPAALNGLHPSYSVPPTRQ